MFPINGQFYIPMFYYSPHPILIANPQILYPEMNIFHRLENFPEPAISTTSKVWIERETEKNNQNSELYIPAQHESKIKDFVKRKLIRKKIQKAPDSIEQTQRLRRKLANRPKTYKTEKKMYMSATLPTLGIIDQQKRVLRKNRQQTKRYKIPQGTSLRLYAEQNRNQNSKFEKYEQEKQTEKFKRNIEKIDKKLEFYNPEAQIPKLNNETMRFDQEIQQKKADLLSRKFSQINNFLQ